MSTNFENVAALVAATLPANKIVETKGYTTSGDGGAGRYLVKTAAQATADGDVIDGYGNHTLANGNVAILQPDNGVINVRQYGAVGDGVVDDTLPIQTVLAKNVTCAIPAGTYLVKDRLEITRPVTAIGRFTLKFTTPTSGGYTTTQNPYTPSVGSAIDACIWISSAGFLENCVIDVSDIDGDATYASTWAVNIQNVYGRPGIRNVRVAADTGAITHNLSGATVRYCNITHIDNCYLDKLKNGIEFENAAGCRISLTTCERMSALPYKLNNSSHCTLSNVWSENHDGGTTAIQVSSSNDNLIDGFTHSYEYGAGNFIANVTSGVGNKFMRLQDQSATKNHFSIRFGSTAYSRPNYVDERWQQNAKGEAYGAAVDAHSAYKNEVIGYVDSSTGTATNLYLGIIPIGSTVEFDIVSRDATTAFIFEIVRRAGSDVVEYTSDSITDTRGSVTTSTTMNVDTTAAYYVRYVSGTGAVTINAKISNINWSSFV